MFLIKLAPWHCVLLLLNSNVGKKSERRRKRDARARRNERRRKMKINVKLVQHRITVNVVSCCHRVRRLVHTRSVYTLRSVVWPDDDARRVSESFCSRVCGAAFVWQCTTHCFNHFLSRDGISSNSTAEWNKGE